jgi:CheY-like chemotaxis protein
VTVIGSLEDLSFPDILQVVHVSRQSGTLVLGSPAGERRVRFRSGLVCGATLGHEGPELEDLLLQRGLVDAVALRMARERSARTGEPLPSVLVDLGAVAQVTLEEVVRDELRAVLRSLVLLHEGEFRFEIEDREAAAGTAELGLREGLAPENILQGIPRRSAGRNGRARRTASRTERIPRRPVLLVIERSALRLRLRESLSGRGYEVDAAASAAEGLALGRTLAGAGRSFTLVADLLLADEGVDGWSGGLELVRRIRAMAPEVNAVLVGELRDEAAARQARSAGADGYLVLPDLGGASWEEVGATLKEACERVRGVLEDPERLAIAPSRVGNGSIRVGDPLSLLRGLIGEMRGEEESGIPLLVLRLAAEYFERGILFAVREGQVFGAGAFGGSDDTEAGGLDTRIRGIALPLQRGSVLQQSVQERETYVGPVAATRPNAPLLEKLGAPAPREAALLPLLAGRHVFAILYGDNARSGRPVGDLRALEIFLSQAGIALENAFLQRRIATLAGGGSRRGSVPHA